MPPLTFPQTATSALGPMDSAVSDRLVPSKLTPGLDMTITDFCAQFGLDDKVRDQLADEGYRNTASLVHISISDLSKTGFKRGEIAEIQVAIAKWAVEKA